MAIHDVGTYRVIWQSYAITDVGCVREVNEDAILNHTGRGLWAVADGMGGHHKGDFASATIMRYLETVVVGNRLSDTVDRIDDALINANHDLTEHVLHASSPKTIGSTAVCLHIKDNIGVVLWAGDSRLYRVRDGQLQQLTRDHSQVEALLQLGIISDEEAEHHPHKNVITRAVGVEPELYVDVNVFSTRPEDTFLLCSDGLYNTVSQTQVETKLAHRDVEACAIDLMKTALFNGAPDNVSVIVVRGMPTSI